MIGDYAINNSMLIQFTYDRVGRNICCCFVIPHLSVTLYFPCSSPFPSLLYPSYLCYCLPFISILRPQKNVCGKGCVMDQAIRFQPLNMEAWIWSQTSPYGIYGGKSGTETDFFSEYIGFPLHHGSNAPYSYFIHLSSLMYVINYWKCLCLSAPRIKTLHTSLNLLSFCFLFSQAIGYAFCLHKCWWWPFHSFC